MTSDLQTLDLFEIHNDRHTLTLLHGLQVERLEERAITGGDRPNGMRLSIADPVRRVKAFFDPWWALSIDEGVGTRGHILEDYLEVALFKDDKLGGRYAGCEYKAQAPIQWHTHGRSAFDWVVTVDGTDRPVSCKSSIKSDTPTSANIDQERRMMALAGYAPGSLFEVWVINPSTFRATGPHIYTLDESHIESARREAFGVADAFIHFSAFDQPTREPEWNDPEWWQGLGLESNSGAFRYSPKDASAAIEARVAAERRAVAQAKHAKAEADALTERIYEFVDEQIAAANREGEAVKSITAYGGSELVTYGRKSNGAKQITTRPFEDAHSAA